MGKGNAAMIGVTHPVNPNSNIRAPVAKNAPSTCSHGRCSNDAPTTTVPGIVQKKASGCRYSQEAVMVRMPLTKKAPKSQEAN